MTPWRESVTDAPAKRHPSRLHAIITSRHRIYQQFITCVVQARCSTQSQNFHFFSRAILLFGIMDHDNTPNKKHQDHHTPAQERTPKPRTHKKKHHITHKTYTHLSSHHKKSTLYAIKSPIGQEPTKPPPPLPSTRHYCRHNPHIYHPLSLTSVERVSLRVHRRLSPLRRAKPVPTPLRNGSVQPRDAEMRVRQRRAISLHVDQPWRRVVLSDAKRLHAAREEFNIYFLPDTVDGNAHMEGAGVRRGGASGNCGGRRYTRGKHGYKHWILGSHC